MSVPHADYMPILTCSQCELAKTIDCFLQGELVCDHCYAKNEGLPAPNMRTQPAPLTLWITGKISPEDADLLVEDGWREDATSGFLYKMLQRWPNEGQEDFR